MCTDVDSSYFFHLMSLAERSRGGWWFDWPVPRAYLFPRLYPAGRGRDFTVVRSLYARLMTSSPLAANYLNTFTSGASSGCPGRLQCGNEGVG